MNSQERHPNRTFPDKPGLRSPDLSGLRNMAICLAVYLAFVWTTLPTSAEETERASLEAQVSLRRIESRSSTPIQVQWHSDRKNVRSLYNLTVSANKGTPETSARQFLSDYRGLFGLDDSGVELRVKDIQHSLTGTHVRLHQYYHGVEVHSGEISVHFNRFGQIRVVHSNYFPHIHTNTVPSISPGEAVNIAAQDANVRTLQVPKVSRFSGFRSARHADVVIFPIRERLRAGNASDA